MKRLVLIISLLLCCTPALFAAEYTGRVSWIYDGDTLQVDGIGRVRLLGIDTPEAKGSSRDRFYQNNFAIAPKKLRQISQQVKRFNIDTTKGVRVRLVTEAQEHDKHGRLLAYLYLPDGRQLNRILLEKGLATVFRSYQFSLKDDFFTAENSARSAKIGLWQQ
ncbi:MAG TPA: thermonuclease family protein [Malonomonas sp.]